MGIVLIGAKLVLGGEKCWKVRRQGEFIVAYHWIRLPGEEETDCVMFIYPLRKSLGARPFGVRQRDAYLYARNDGYPSADLLAACERAAAQMGMPTTRSTPRGIADVILDGLEDLIRMPPERPKKDTTTAPLGIATLFSQGKQVAEGEVTTGPETVH